MLLFSDEQLVAREHVLPGFRFLLDPELLRDLLLQHTPGFPVETIDPKYVRYKPGMNCLAAYQITSNGCQIDVYAKAYQLQELEKLKKSKKREVLNSRSGYGVVLVPEKGIVLSFFPNDGKLRSLARLISPEQRRPAFQRLFKNQPDLWDCDVQKLSYKPERRYVARLVSGGVPRAVLRCYLESDFYTARANAKLFQSSENIRIPKKIAHSKQNSWIAYEWVDGTELDPSSDELEQFRNAGSAIAELHSAKPHEMAHLTRERMIRRVLEQIEDLSFLYPDLERSIRHTAGKLSAQLLKEPDDPCPIHGDFNSTQIVNLPNKGIGILDLDEVVYGDAACDLGNFIANLQRDEIAGNISTDRCAQLSAALLDGYRRTRNLRQNYLLYVAFGLFRMVAEPFRYRQPDWYEAGRRILQHIQTSVSELAKNRSQTLHPATITPEQSSQVPVIDPFDVTKDSAMPFLGDALSPLQMQFLFGKHLPFSKVHPLSIRVTRYKPGRRCLVEYELVASYAEEESTAPSTITLIGKARAKGTDRQAFQILQRLHQGSFGSESLAGISVPEPVAMIPDLHMYLQRKVKGVTASELFRKAISQDVSARIAEAIHELHQAAVPAQRTHSVADELHILRERLAIVSEKFSFLASRIAILLTDCESVASRLAGDSICGIHRDFYPDQVLFSGDRIILLDFDSYCMGHPALDAGNFIAHVTEQSLRELGNAEGWKRYEDAFRSRFLQLAGAHLTEAVEIYTILSLARHVSLSTQFPDRVSFTESLLELCENRISRLRSNMERSCR